MKKVERLVSLDAFRGITIAGMILVNKPGNWDHVYPPLLHADWHGWTPTDLIFPFFLFIVGVAMAFSMGRRLQSGSAVSLYRKVFTRSLIIFLLGIFLNLFPTFDFASLRFAGVLQRIAVVYLLAALVVIHTGIKGQALTAGGLLLFYWAVMKLIPVPGFGAGVLTPEGNLAAFVDSLLLPGRMWQGTWDPEGFLSTIPSVSTTLLGVLTGHWLRSGRDRRELTAGLFVAGWAAIVAALFWSIWFPINKNLWTSSFTLFTAGAALQFLGFCFYLIDVKDHRRWFYPAIVYGMNPIAVYVLSGMLIDIFHAVPVRVGGESASLMDWIFTDLFLSWADPMNASLAFALCYVAFWCLIMHFFYKRKIFIKI